GEAAAVALSTKRSRRSWRRSRTTTSTSTSSPAVRAESTARRPGVSRGSTMPPVRRLPQRTCVVCRSTTAKRELVRVVRTPAGDVMVDEGGKANGRGAYLCRAFDCWEAALKRDRLSGPLKIKVGPEARKRLARFAEALRPAQDNDSKAAVAESE